MAKKQLRTYPHRPQIHPLPRIHRLCPALGAEAGSVDEHTIRRSANKHRRTNKKMQSHQHPVTRDVKAFLHRIPHHPHRVHFHKRPSKMLGSNMAAPVVGPDASAVSLPPVRPVRPLHQSSLSTISSSSTGSSILPEVVKEEELAHSSVALKAK